LLQIFSPSIFCAESPNVKDVVPVQQRGDEIEGCEATEAEADA
jgi:hypothetical protein